MAKRKEWLEGGPAKPEAPEDAQEDGFVYDQYHKQFRVWNKDAIGDRDRSLPRGRPSQWRRDLSFSPNPQHRLDQAHRQFSNEYIIAQLKHFGISYPEDMNEGRLAQVFLNYLDGDQFDNVPLSVTAIEKRLEEETERRNIAHQAELRAYEASCVERRETAFARAESLSEKAMIDENLFMRTYFLDVAGNPDPTKHPGIIRLDGILYRVPFFVTTAASQVPGITVESYSWEVDDEGDDVSTVFIGWDADEVTRAYAEYVAQAEAEIKRRHEERLGDHLRYVAKADWNKSPVGRYLVRCPDIEGRNGWNAPDGLYITIHDWYDCMINHHATIEFGYLRGEMLLAETLEDLQDHCRQQLWRYDAPNPSSHVYSAPGKDGKEPASPGSEQLPSLSYHFVYRSFVAATGQALTKYYHEMRGRLEFTDTTFAKFGIEMDLELNGGSWSTLGGVKISNSVSGEDDVNYYWEDDSLCGEETVTLKEPEEEDVASESGLMDNEGD